MKCSKNFNNSWKWRQILGISKILGNDVMYFWKRLKKKNFCWKFDFVSGETRVDRRSLEEFFPEFQHFLKVMSNSWNFLAFLGSDVKFLELSKFLNEQNFLPIFSFCIRRTWIDRRSFEKFFLEFRLLGSEISKFLKVMSNS